MLVKILLAFINKTPKKHLFIVALISFASMFTLFYIGDYINEKVKAEALPLYYQAGEEDTGNAEYTLHNVAVYIQNYNNQYSMQIYGYNNKLFTYKNGEWTEELTRD